MTKDKKWGEVFFQQAMVLCMVLTVCAGTIRTVEAKDLNGTTCANSNIAFNNTSYKAGDTATLSGESASGDWTLCMYNVSTGERVGFGTNTKSISYKTTTSATLAGTIRTNGQCALAYSGIAKDCQADNVTVSTDSGSDDDNDDDSGGGTADKPADSISRCDTNGWFFCNPLAGTVDSLTDAGTKTIQAILGLIGTIALFFLIYAGVTYITAAGQEEKVKTAKKMIAGTIIGLGIALLAFSLLQTVLKILQ